MGRGCWARVVELLLQDGVDVNQDAIVTVSLLRFRLSGEGSYMAFSIGRALRVRCRCGLSVIQIHEQNSGGHGAARQEQPG